MTIAAILLAGGESSRMGTPKPLLEWGGRTLIEYQVEQLREAGCQRVIVVLGHRADEMQPLVERAGGIAFVNERYANGRASSLRAGAVAIGNDVTTIVVLNVDQPRPASVTRRLLEEQRRAHSLITLPAHGGRRGHPAIVDGSLLNEVRDVRDETFGLRAVIERHEPVHEVEFEWDIVLLGMNTPQEYESAKAKYCHQVPL